MARIHVWHKHWVKSPLLNSDVVTGLGRLVIRDRSRSVHQETSEAGKSNSSCLGTESRQVIGENKLQRQVRDKVGRSQADRQENKARKSHITQKKIWPWASQSPELKERRRLANEPVRLISGCSAGEETTGRPAATSQTFLSYGLVFLKPIIQPWLCVCKTAWGLHLVYVENALVSLKLQIWNILIHINLSKLSKLKAITKLICLYCWVKTNRLLLLLSTHQKLQICSTAGSPSARQPVISRSKTWPMQLREVTLEVGSCRLSCRGLKASSKALKQV